MKKIVLALSLIVASLAPMGGLVSAEVNLPKLMIPDFEVGDGGGNIYVIPIENYNDCHCQNRQIVVKDGENQIATKYIDGNTIFIYFETKFYYKQKLDFYLRDNQGNETYITSKIILKDTISPDFDGRYHVDPITIRSTKITGFTEPGATVEVVIGKSIYKSIVADNGKYSVVIPKQKLGTIIYIRAIDIANNSSDYVQLAVAGAPGSIDTRDITTNTTNVTGTVYGNLKGDYAQIVIGKKAYKGTINSKHQFLIKIPKQKARTILKVQFVDSLGSEIDYDNRRVYTTKNVKVGMTQSQVLDTSWGEPLRKTKSVSNLGVYETWTYKKSPYGYLYLNFKNGKISFIQDL